MLNFYRFHFEKFFRLLRKYTRLLLRLFVLIVICWYLVSNLYLASRFYLEPYNSRKDNILNAETFDTKIDFLNRIQRKPYDINCQLITEWNEQEIFKAKKLLFKLKNFSYEINSKENNLVHLLPDLNYVFESSKCNLFRNLRGYNQYKIHDFEKKFPIAFSILTYNNVEQFERLLKIIYRPHNVYCIHVDKKSSPLFHLAIKSITDCFQNVFIATKLEKIIYAGYERLKADINCMEDLIYFENRSFHQNFIGKNFSRDWKYLINLASTEFPLRTNYELARILSIYNGANDIEVMENFSKERVIYSWIVKKNTKTSEEYLQRTRTLKTSPPFNFTIVKGIVYCSFSRKFVEYTLFNEYAKSLLEWSKDTYSPDEWYWATLQYNIQFNPPGGFKHTTKKSVPTRARYIGWKNLYNCKGELRHNICVFSLEDIPELVTRNEFFLNKLLLSYDPLTYQCMEQWINNKVSLTQTINVIYYCRLLFIIPYSINPRCARLLE